MTPTNTVNTYQQEEEEGPPLLRTWTRVYLFIIVYLLTGIACLWYITRLLAY